MESNIMINEFISEDYKNSITTTIDNVIIKKSKAFTEDGERRERTYIDNGGNFMTMIEIIEEKSTSSVKKHSIYNTFVWNGTKDALTVDYRLLVDAINKSDGEKKEQLQALLEKLSNDHILINAVGEKRTYAF